MLWTSRKQGYGSTVTSRVALPLVSMASARHIHRKRTSRSDVTLHAFRRTTLASVTSVGVAVRLPNYVRKRTYSPVTAAASQHGIFGAIGVNKLTSPPLEAPIDATICPLPMPRIMIVHTLTIGSRFRRWSLRCTPATPLLESHGISARQAAAADPIQTAPFCRLIVHTR